MDAGTALAKGLGNTIANAARAANHKHGISREISIVHFNYPF